jgi:hypothetical protein
MTDKKGTGESSQSDPLRDALAAVWNGEPSADLALRKATEDNPVLTGLLVKQWGDAAARAERQMIEGAAQGDQVRVFYTGEWLAEFRASLVEPGDTGLEQMLVSRVSLCTLAVNQAESDRAGAWKKGGLSPEVADFYDRHVSRLNSDLLKATRALATVRKLRRPVVQVNLAEQQINIAG